MILCPHCLNFRDFRPSRLLVLDCSHLYSMPSASVKAAPEFVQRCWSRMSLPEYPRVMYVDMPLCCRLPVPVAPTGCEASCSHLRRVWQPAESRCWLQSPGARIVATEPRVPEDIPSAWLSSVAGCRECAQDLLSPVKIILDTGDKSCLMWSRIELRESSIAKLWISLRQHLRVYEAEVVLTAAEDIILQY